MNKKSSATKAGAQYPFDFLLFLKHTALSLLLLAFVSCSNNQKPDPSKSLEKVSQMPPSMTDGKKFIEIDPVLLASGKDLVCNMKIKNKIADTASYKNKIYGFCGRGCKEAFVAEPLTYINSAN